MSDDGWRGTMAVNLDGVFCCTRAALRFLEPQRSGQVINITSISGLGAASVHSPGCSASKEGVISLTRTTAYDVAGADGRLPSGHSIALSEAGRAKLPIPQSVHGATR